MASYGKKLTKTSRMPGVPQHQIPIEFVVKVYKNCLKYEKDSV